MSDPPPDAPAPDPDGGKPGHRPPDRRVVTVAILLVAIVLASIALIVVGGDDGDEPSAAGTTTSTAPSASRSTTTSTTMTSTTTTTTTTTTTATAPAATGSTTTTTTTAPTTSTRVTIARDRCTGSTGRDDPDAVALTFHEAWTVDDRGCAEAIASDEAVDDLFRFEGSNTDWTFRSCGRTRSGDEGSRDRRSVCSFRYEGGVARFEMGSPNDEGWRVDAVMFEPD